MTAVTCVRLRFVVGLLPMAAQTGTAIALAAAPMGPNVAGCALPVLGNPVQARQRIAMAAHAGRDPRRICALARITVGVMARPAVVVAAVGCLAHPRVAGQTRRCCPPRSVRHVAVAAAVVSGASAPVLLGVAGCARPLARLGRVSIVAGETIAVTLVDVHAFVATGARPGIGRRVRGSKRARPERMGMARVASGAVSMSPYPSHDCRPFPVAILAGPGLSGSRNERMRPVTLRADCLAPMQAVVARCAEPVVAGGARECGCAVRQACACAARPRRVHRMAA